MTPFLQISELATGQANPETTANLALRRLEAAISIDVLDKDLTVAPGVPGATDRYIIPAGATGTWAGKTNKIAYNQGGNWGYLTPRTGWFAYVADEGSRYLWNGSAWTGLTVTNPDEADEVTYDNLTSGLSATDVQAAIVELWALLDSLTGGTEAEECTEPPALVDSILDDSPTAYWKCDEATGTTLEDLSGNGNHLTLSGTYEQAQSALVPSLPFENYLYLNGGASDGASVAGALGQSVPFTGDWTIEAIVASQDDAVLSSILSINGSGETEAVNVQAALMQASTGFIRTFWEHSAGTDANTTSTVGPIEEGKVYHLVAVKDGTANTVHFYLNGIWVETVAYTNEPTGGSSVTTFLGNNGGSGWKGLIGHVAFYGGQKLTQDRIAVHAWAAGLLAT